MDLSEELERLSLGVSTTLEIGPSPSPAATVPTFKGQKCIGKFHTTGKDKCSSDDVTIVKLQPNWKTLPQRRINLATDFNKATLIPDYTAYHNQKQKHFLDWIISNKYFEKVEKKEYKKPDFICFGGRITDTMISPGENRFGDWIMYAAKFNDTIYLWDEKLDERTGHSKESYYGIYFEHLMTSGNPAAAAPNEFDKVYVVNEVTFGSHQLLCLNEVDAVDESGNWVELKVFRAGAPRGTMNAKLLKFWGQSVVPGVQKLVLGSRDDNGFLVKVEESSTDKIAKDAASAWNAKACYNFEDRLLKWIATHFKENDPKVVKKFSRDPGGSTVKCQNVPERSIPKFLLPDWYVKGVELQMTGGAAKDDEKKKDVPVKKSVK